MDDYSQALSGGVLIGLASWILLAGVGRVSGVSNITARILTGRAQSSGWRWMFLLGLVLGGAMFSWLLNIPHVETRHVIVLAPAGFLVGFGAVLGSGCTSGHGVCGLGRRSMRSLVAVIIFVGVGIVTVTVASLVPGAKWWEQFLLDMLHLIVRR